ALLAVRGLLQRALRLARQPDRIEHLECAGGQTAIPVERTPVPPAQRRLSEQRQLHVVQQVVAAEQRHDLVGARQAELGTRGRGGVRDGFAQQRDAARVGGQVARDQVEQRGLAGAVGADQQVPLALLDPQVDRARDLQPAEGLAQIGDFDDGAHVVFSSGPDFSMGRAVRRRGRRRRASPATMPPGMNITMMMNTKPSSMIHRSMYALATFLSRTTSAAPTTGPLSVPAPPAITISSISAEFASDRLCGLMNWW